MLNAHDNPSQQIPPTTRWGQERRLEFIDYRLLWERTVNRIELVSYFGISAQQASADLAAYMKLAPDNLVYDRSLKTYRATSMFKSVIASDDAHGYLSDLASLVTGSTKPSSSMIGWQPPCDMVHYPVRPIPTGILTRVLWAIRDNEDLKVIYQSMRRPSATVRWIAPHAIAFDGFRWHVRAWCNENNAFRDFVISRIQNVKESRKAVVDGTSDLLWNTFIDVILRPRDGLTQDQKSAIDIDFGMTNGLLKITCRKALAFYLLRQLQLDRPTDLSPIVQPLELVNREELSSLICAAAKSPEAQ